ncbi:MAG: hypothetical protein NTY30_03445 [Candidatus Berkelbacteria bacterium]|nr:hypothetical protein [Candidatus Berkelbacteria bacterium]
MIEFKTKQKIKQGITKAIEILIQTGKLIDEGLYFVSVEKLKKETSYLEGDPRRLSNRIHSLERNGYVKIDRKSNSVELTNKGQIKLLENSDDNQIDGKWRFLSWDIPEKLANKRIMFCRMIKRIGYKQAQKSLWVSPFVRSDKVYLIIEELGIGKFVAYIVAEKTDIDHHLKSLFKKELS